MRAGWVMAVGLGFGDRRSAARSDDRGLAWGKQATAGRVHYAAERINGRLWSSPSLGKRLTGVLAYCFATLRGRACVLLVAW